MLEEEEIETLAGPGAFTRGQTYFTQNRVALTEATDTGFQAIASGSREYHLQLVVADDAPRWECTCPAAADGAFCKHLVAATLLWQEGGPGNPSARPADDPLLEKLRQQPVENLARWLFEAAQYNPSLEKRLNLVLSGDNPDELKRALGKLLNAGGFLDYHRSMDYAMRLDTPLALLRDLLPKDPDQCLALCEYALFRLLRIYERADDSAGTIGDRLHDFAELHTEACARADINGKKLARSLLKLQRADDWGLFPLQRYWPLLKASGQQVWKQAILKDYQQLPPPSPKSQHRFGTFDKAAMAAFPILHRRTELARVEEDFDGLLEVLRRDLPSGHAYERIITACREFGRERETMQWAEHGVRDNPDHLRLRVMLADEYARAGLTDEACEQLYLAMSGPAPDPQLWRRLRELSGEHWPGYRARILEGLSEREPKAAGDRPNATRRVTLLHQVGEHQAARELARSSAVNPHILLDLAPDIADTHPEDAGHFSQRAIDVLLEPSTARDYAWLVDCIGKASHWLPASEARTWLASIREKYRRKRKLMTLLDEAGL